MNIIQAKQAIDYFHINKFKQIKNSAAYELQQACEKLIKIQIYNTSNIIVDNYSLYTHNLSKLYTYANSLGVNLIVPSYIVSNFDKITDWEAGSRYNMGFSVRIDVLEKCYKEVVFWYGTLYSKGHR